MNITTANNPISEVFHFDGYKQIRTMFRPEDNAVLFCGKDVAEALGYKNTRDALLKHCRRQVTLDLRQASNTVVICAGNPNAVFIPESDVYRLIMKSRLKTAEKFEEWVCEEVLPSIRRSGMYSKAVAESNLKPELQHAITTHIEAQTKRMLDRLDRLDYYGDISKEAKASICEKVAKEFNAPLTLIQELQTNGLHGVIQ
ncbi:TPA: BRO-N domain-containing protein [Aeromonas hydrophila]